MQVSFKFNPEGVLVNCVRQDGRWKSHPGINSSVFRLDELKDVKISLALSTITQAEHLAQNT